MEKIRYSYNHNHTEHSNLRILDCTIKVEHLIDEAIKKGANALCITDHESLSSHIRAMCHIKKLKEKNPELDFKIGYGDEIYLVNSLFEVRDNYVGGGQTKFPHFILVAKDLKGYEQLRKISSTAWSNSFYTGKMERVPVEKTQLEQIIGNNKGHLMASSACIGGELGTLVVKYLESNKSQETKLAIHNYMTWCIDLFGKENFFIEIQPSNMQDQINFNQTIIPIAKAYGLKVHITTDTHYLNIEDKDTHKAYLNSRDGDREIEDFYTTTYLLTPSEMQQYVPYIDEKEFETILSNTYSFVEHIEEFDMFHKTIIPERDLSNILFEVGHIFNEWYDKCEYVHKFAYSEFEQDRYFLYMIEQGFLDKKQEFNEVNIMRINTELKELWLISEKLKERMSSYYVLVDYIVDLMWEIGFVGVSRGSVAGFYTCYLIDIQQVNPIEWELVHWRHITAERVDGLPDIDLDTSAKNRPLIIEKLREVFGRNRVLNICTFKTEGTKSVVLTVCRGVGIDTDEAQYLSSMIPSERGKLWSLGDCFFGNEEKNRKPNKEFINEIERLSKEKNRDIKQMVLNLEGLICGRSIHASGVYLFKDSYINQNALMKAPNGVPVTQWSMEDSDLAGGLKFDALTTEAEDKLEVCMDLLLKNGVIEDKGSIRETYNAYLHPDVLEYKDPRIWELCNKGEVIDLFQFMTQVGGTCIKKGQPTNLEEMALLNSIMRLMGEGEAPIDRYVRLKSNICEWYKEMQEYNLNLLEIETMKDHILKYYGCCADQESLMIILMDKRISGFDLVGANYARKIIAKKKTEKVEELKQKFYESGLALGNSEAILNYVWEFCVKIQLG